MDGEVGFYGGRTAGRLTVGRLPLLAQGTADDAVGVVGGEGQAQDAVGRLVVGGGGEALQEPDGGGQ
jgi:hypothetical protein